MQGSSVPARANWNFSSHLGTRPAR